MPRFKKKELIMTKSSRRQSWIDCIRGIGIILVVLAHYIHGDNPLCKWISSFHMPLFFILSGILIAMHEAYADKPLRSVLLRRAKQLLYPYLTFSILIIIYYLLRGRPDTASKVFYYTFTLEGHNTMWFLPALWMAECILLVLLRSRIPDLASTIVLLLGTTIYAALQYYVIGGAVPADEGLHYLILNGLCRSGIGSIYMMAGYKGYLLRTKFANLKKHTLRLCAAAAFVSGIFLGYINASVDLHYCALSNPLLYYLAALLQCSGLIVFCAVTVQRSALLEFFGRSSLIIMATHYPLPVINLAQYMLQNLSTGMRYADALIGCSLVMLFEAVLILIINRYCPFLLRMPVTDRSR